MIRALFLLVFLVSYPAQATTSLLSGGWSQHFPAGNYRETHHGLGLEIEHDAGPAHVGGVLWDFTNSYDEQSIYLGGTLKRCEGSLDELRGCLGLTVGLADGYDVVSGMEVSPLGGITLEVSQGRFGLFVVCVPPAGAGTAGVCMVALKLRPEPLTAPAF